jgi:hypothetical protein
MNPTINMSRRNTDPVLKEKNMREKDEQRGRNNHNWSKIEEGHKQLLDIINEKYRFNSDGSIEEK